MNDKDELLKALDKYVDYKMRKKLQELDIWI